MSSFEGPVAAQVGMFSSWLLEHRDELARQIASVEGTSRFEIALRYVADGMTPPEIAVTVDKLSREMAARWEIDRATEPDGCENR